MRSKNHHIQKQEVILEFSTEEKAREWNNRFSEFYHREILPPLGTLLDRKIPNDRTFVIDRLEINLGVVPIDRFIERLMKLTEQELTRLLENEPEIFTRHDRDDGKKKKHKADDPERLRRQATPGRQHETESGRDAGNLRVVGEQEYTLSIFFHFLEHGSFPWYSDITSTDELEKEIHQELGIEVLTSEPVYQKRIRALPARNRLWYQFSRAFSEGIFNRIFPEEKARLDAVQQALKEPLLSFAKDASSREMIQQELSENVWVHVFPSPPADETRWPLHLIRSITEKLIPFFTIPSQSQRAAGKGSSSETEWIYQTIAEDLPSTTELAVHLKELVSQGTDRDLEVDNSSSEAAPTDMDTSTEETESDDPSNQTVGDEHEATTDTPQDRKVHLEDQNRGKVSGKETSTGQEDSEAADDENIRAKRDDDSSHRRKSDSQEKADSHEGETEPEHSGPDSVAPGAPDNRHPVHEADDVEEIGSEDLPEPLEEYYLKNAGFILCWPYLTRLFNQLEYLNDRTFKTTHTQQRAIHLLGYIASGQEQCGEHELILAKLLTSWPIQMPIVRDLELTADEKEQADEMLEGLIAHWSILQKTSVDGLRESFFVRDGKLLNEESQWRLIVEQKSFDMLLDHLPFTISIIKLPWMKEVLKVDWA